MADFSSCYFCGAALDAPLEEYPVVPAELHPSPERQGTVVLCPTCRGKLDAILEDVIGAVEVDSSLGGRRPTDSTLQAATEGATTGSDAEPEAADVPEPEAADVPEPEAADDTGSTPTADAEPGDEATAGDGSDDQASDDETESEPSTPSTTAGSQSDPDQSPVFDDGSSAESDESDPYDPVFDDEAEGSTSTDPVGGDATEDGDETAADDRDESTDDRRGSTASADRAGGSSDPMPDARTYNRVIRLLQNREFPVDRDEIETVATNAYELSHEEFDAVIRVAIDRGVLEEADGQLVLPG
ncbi:MAG: hypothetical protein V5A33_05330, partial [Halobacteriales archaeon]